MTASDTCRLIPSRYPSTGILDVVAGLDDLQAVTELESWTNDRVSAELGILHRLPREEWVTGRPMSSVVMAPFCHPHPQGGRFNGPGRGAWYAALQLETAQREVLHHRTAELLEVGIARAVLQMRLYLADFTGPFHDLRIKLRSNEKYLNPFSYQASQRLASKLLDSGSIGVVYPSVRHAGGECLACFRPASVRNVRVGGHYELHWSGSDEPSFRRLH